MADSRVNTLIDELLTVRDWLRWAVSRFHAAGLCYGHGTDNAYDEAVWLILHTLHLPNDSLASFIDARLTRNERLAVLNILNQRLVRRLPAAYLTQEAWLGPWRFHVDERVIVPRSYFAELLAEQMAPWVADPERIRRGLDLCTGSGCLAILMAQAFPNAQIDAVDISADALAVARRNVDDYALNDRIRLIQSDAVADVHERYDLIICNPPYVTADSMAALPAEYRHEPELALAAGDDGLDFVRRLLASARKHLTNDGLLFVEIGHNADTVEAAFSELPLIWVDTPSSENKIFMLTQDAL
jgi:ribosomal protein L3 glutamine methyltransferase